MTGTAPLFRHRQSRYLLSLLLTALLVAVCSVFDLAIGARYISPETVVRALVAYDPHNFNHHVVVELRLLRLIAALLIGSALGVAGLLLQSVIRNPLGEPHILGLNAGAALAVVMSTACGATWLTLPGIRPLVAAGGAALLFSLVILFSSAGRSGLTVMKVTLCGVALSAFASSLTATVLLLDEQTMMDMRTWLAGDLAGLSWPGVQAAAIPVALAILLAGWLAPSLNALALGDHLARGLGVDLRRTRILSIFAIALLSGAAVSLAGPIGFVGLIVPNVVRRLVTEDVRKAIPCCALCGALVLLVADIAARTLIAPQELATGVMTALAGAPVFIFIASRFLNEPLLRAVGWKALRQGRWSVLLRPATLVRLALFLLLILLLLVFGISHGSLQVPVSGVARALFYPQEVHDPSLFIVRGVRLPRLLMAVTVGAMLGMAGAAMQSITRNGLADPGLLGVKEGASIVVLTQILFFPALGMLWQPVTGMAGGLLVSALVVLLGRDFSRPRFILIGIGISWIFAAAIGVFMTTADVRQVQTVMLWMAGSLNTVSWPLLLISLCWGIPAILLLFLTARASDIALLGNAAATGLGVRLSQLTLLRFIAPVILTATCISCVGSIGFVGLMAPHLSRMLFRGGQSALLSGSAVCGGVLVLLADNVGRLAFAPLQLPAGIVISLLGGPFFLLLLWQRRDKF